MEIGKLEGKGATVTWLSIDHYRGVTWGSYNANGRKVRAWFLWVGVAEVLIVALKRKVDQGSCILKTEECRYRITCRKKLEEGMFYRKPWIWRKSVSGNLECGGVRAYKCCVSWLGVVRWFYFWLSSNGSEKLYDSSSFRQGSSFWFCPL